MKIKPALRKIFLNPHPARATREFLAYHQFQQQSDNLL